MMTGGVLRFFVTGISNWTYIWPIVIWFGTGLAGRRHRRVIGNLRHASDEEAALVFDHQGLRQELLHFWGILSGGQPRQGEKQHNGFHEISSFSLEAVPCGRLRQIHRAEHRHALLAQRIVLHFALVVEDHGRPVLGVERRPLRSLGVFGLPVLANAIHALLTLSARAGASGLLDVMLLVLMLSNANGISIVWGDL